MGDYKEKNGRSRAGVFLEKLGERAAPLAKMGLEIASGVTGIKQLNTLVDAIRSSDQLDQDEKATALDLLKLDLEEAKEITKRWVSDNQSDSKLAKIVRPLTLMILLLFIFVFAMLDSMEIAFSVKDHWVSLIEALSISAFLAYFGSRGYEKARSK